MRHILVLLSALISFSVSSQEYTVSVPIDGLSDKEVRNAARIKVQWEAAMNYPVLISGREYTNEMDEYRSEITAMTVGAVNVSTVSERWLREQNRLEYTGLATLNEAVTLDAFEDLRNNISLQKELQEAYEKMNAIVSGQSIDADQFLLSAQKANVASKVYYAQGTLEETLKAKAVLRDYFLNVVMYDYYLAFIDSLTFKLVDAGAGYVTYEASSTWYNKLSFACKKVIPFYREQFNSRSYYYQRCIESDFSEYSHVLVSAIEQIDLHTPIESVQSSGSGERPVFHFKLDGLSPNQVETYLREPGKIVEQFYVVFTL